MWYYENDSSQPVITAQEQISVHRGRSAYSLSKTAVVFFMSKGVEYLQKHTNAIELPEKFPRFLNRCPIWTAEEEHAFCFLDGGRGAPQAADTVETLAVLGVKKVIAVGMFGAFSRAVSVGEIVTPCKAFVEEGTSLHYYKSIAYSEPDGSLLSDANSILDVKSQAIVSTDAVYRQTFMKEQIWRENGAVGVDMETSAAFSVGKYVGLSVVSLLMVSDVHPMSPDEPKWDWRMTGEMRNELFDKLLLFVRNMG